MELVKETQPQLIDPEVIKPFYVLQLELQNRQLSLAKADAENNTAMLEVRAAFSKLFTDAGLVQDEFDVNLKTGILTKRKETQ